VNFRPSVIKSDLLLLLTAVIWGFAFVAQRLGMEYIGPLLFNGIRFGLGALVMWGAIRFRGWRKGEEERRREGEGENGTVLKTDDWRLTTVRGIFLGLILFAGATFQQVGIVYTTAGHAGFITGLYVILVPLIGIFMGQKAGANLWAGALIAVVGMYFLTVAHSFTMVRGDVLVLISAMFFAMHVVYTGWLSPKHSALRLALVQYLVVSLMSLAGAFFFESNSILGVWKAAWPILYGGILSVGIAYTLQIVAQKKAPPTHAAIIMSLEAVFAVIGGVIMLSEPMSNRKWLGCSLMLAGMLLAQFRKREQQQ